MQVPVPGESEVDAIIVGGGLAGLIAAIAIARDGRRVILLERSRALGGRASTRIEQDIHFNWGPHALYCRGPAFQLLQELGIPFSGRFPRTQGAMLTTETDTFPLPRGLSELLVSRLFTWREKWTAVKILGTLNRLDTRRLDRVPLADWLERAAGNGNLARFLRTLFRVGTYIEDAERLSAGAAIDQFRLALQGNVWYLDGGWQTLVDGLRKHATDRGVRLRTGSRVVSVHGDDEEVSLRLASGESVRGRAAVLAVDPETAGELLDLPEDSGFAHWSRRRIPVRAACLDVALARLPHPERCVVFGLDRPLYYSVHSASARLAPPGVAVIHVMKYLREETAAAAQDSEAELEGLLDRLQPGWRTHTLARRFLPGMTVAHGLPLAEGGGLSDRPEVAVPGACNLFLSGDWVGAEGLLADASAASAMEAAERVLAVLARPRIPRERSLTHGSG